VYAISHRSDAGWIRTIHLGVADLAVPTGYSIFLSDHKKTGGFVFIFKTKPPVFPVSSLFFAFLFYQFESLFHPG
jgi:hypothetical protein